MAKKFPTNPVTLYFNALLIDGALNELLEKHLPAWEAQVTSGYRNETKNRDVGGSSDSSHLYNLARDIVLVNKASGQMADDTTMKNIFDKFIKPNWQGYTYFSPKQKNTNTGWIHLNIDRDFNKYTKPIGWGLTAIGIGFSANKIIKTILEKRK